MIILKQKSGHRHPDHGPGEDEPWKETLLRSSCIARQSEEGDYASFLRNSALEIKFEGECCLAVPASGILTRSRDLAHDRITDEAFVQRNRSRGGR